MGSKPFTRVVSDDILISLLGSMLSICLSFSFWFYRLKPHSGGTLVTGMERLTVASFAKLKIWSSSWSFNVSPQVSGLSSFFHSLCGSLSLAKTAPEMHFWHGVRVLALTDGYHLTCTACQSDQWLLSEHHFQNHTVAVGYFEECLVTVVTFLRHTCWQIKKWLNGAFCHYC